MRRNKFVSLIVLLNSIICLAACAPSSKTSDADVQNSIDGIKQVYMDLFTILDKNKNTPEKGLSEAESLLTASDSKLMKHGKVLLGVLSMDQIILVDKFKNEVEGMSITFSETTRTQYAKTPGAENRLLAMFNKIRVYHDVKIDRDKIYAYKEEQTRKKADCKKKGNCK